MVVVGVGEYLWVFAEGYNWWCLLLGAEVYLETLVEGKCWRIQLGRFLQKVRAEGYTWGCLKKGTEGFKYGYL